MKLDKLPDINKHKNTEEWWEQSKEILKKNIKEAAKRDVNNDIFKVMLDLLEKAKVRKKNNIVEN